MLFEPLTVRLAVGVVGVGGDGGGGGVTVVLQSLTVNVTGDEVAVILLPSKTLTVLVQVPMSLTLQGFEAEPDQYPFGSRF